MPSSPTCSTAVMPEAFSLPCSYSLRGYRAAESLPGLKAGPLQVVWNIQHFWFACACFPDGLTQRSCLNHNLRKNRGLTQVQGSIPIFSVWIFIGWTAQVFFGNKLHPALPELPPWTVTCDGLANDFTLGVFVKISSSACLKKFKMNIFESTHNRSNHLFLVTLCNSILWNWKSLQCADSLCLQASSFVA